MASGGVVGTRTPSRRPAGSDIVLVVALTAVVCVPVWPGIYTVDSQAILNAARGDRISNWYAPVLGWSWGALDDLGVSPGVLFAATVAAFVVAVLGLVGQFLRPGAARALTAVVVVFPPIYGLLGWMGRDVWFATAAVAITAVALHVHRSRRPSWAALVGLVSLGVAAADARQNGLPFAVLAFGVAASGVSRRLEPAWSDRARFGLVAVGIIAGLVLVEVAQRLVVVVEHHPEQILLVRDLTAVTLDRDAPAMDPFLFPTQDVAALRTALDGRDPDAVIGLGPPLVQYSPYEDHPDAAAANAAFRDQWWTMLREHPAAYFRTRVELFLLQAGISRDVRTPYFGRSDALAGAGAPDELANSLPGLLDARNKYLSWTDGPAGTGSLLHAPVLYMIAAAGSIWAIGRRTGERAAAWLLIGVLGAMQVLLFVTAPTSEYRFQFFQVVFGTVFLAVLVVQGVWPDAAVRTRRPAAPLSRLGRS